MIPLLIYKGIGISQKLSTIDQAEALYEEQNLIDAETLFQKARSNKTIQYKEELVSSRLEELAPITAMKENLSGVLDQASAAAGRGDFERLMDAYAGLQEIRSSYMTPEGPYSEYYKQISEHYGISQSFMDYFKQFRTVLLEEPKRNLEKGHYDDESFKWKLLRMPAHFFGTEQEWLDQLNAVFQQYDETKLERIIASGYVEAMLQNASSMVKQYEAHEHDAPWVIAKTNELMDSLLKQDWDNKDYAAFALHSRQFETFASSASPRSKVLAYAKDGIAKLLRSAKRSTASGNYQEAIDLYRALGNYQDTKAEIRATELAWVAADPVRLLPVYGDGESYRHVAGGTKKFGSSVYVAAIDAGNQLLFGRMNSEEGVQILSNRDLDVHAQIHSLRIDPVLSTSSIPVVVIEADSAAREASYMAFEVLEDRIQLLFSFEADDLIVENDDTLHVVNPHGEGEGETAIYVRYGDHFEFTGVKQTYVDISADDVAFYPGTLVRFTSTITSPGTGEVLAFGQNSYIMLQGDFTFYEGKATVTGRFTHYTEHYMESQESGTTEEQYTSSPDDSIIVGQPAGRFIRIPVVKVESVNQ
ncbi:hypothetical protein QNH46_03225 [Paenibacillus woosongensis]|uniref:Uncharacterized protein n=1 Tax=Paenibacillus woosongensis TaxID=307580 RepID=A0AA95I4J3_9BACL|nr:hypothetical protein [Paenibacillus woosongensis]WHX49710.1 hypothetical protein QNH46_03225 [Paenibacillus woosongensis]